MFFLRFAHTANISPDLMRLFNPINPITANAPVDLLIKFIMEEPVALSFIALDARYDAPGNRIGNS